MFDTKLIADFSFQARVLHSTDQLFHPAPLTSSHKTLRLRSLQLAASTALLLVLLANVIPAASAASTCTRHEYWDGQSSQCVQCSKCSQHEIVVRPCQRHLNTVCKALNTIEIDWSRSLATEQPLHHHNHHHQAPERISAQPSIQDEDEAMWDWQLVSLVLAVAACLMFFVGTALVSLNYVRQWRKIKKEFDHGESASAFSSSTFF
jgi:TNFR/NGFR cysteine-rich region